MASEIQFSKLEEFFVPGSFQADLARSITASSYAIRRRAVDSPYACTGTTRWSFSLRLRISQAAIQCLCVSHRKMEDDWSGHRNTKNGLLPRPLPGEACGHK